MKISAKYPYIQNESSKMRIPLKICKEIVGNGFQTLGPHPMDSAEESKLKTGLKDKE